MRRLKTPNNGVYLYWGKTFHGNSVEKKQFYAFLKLLTCIINHISNSIKFLFKCLNVSLPCNEFYFISVLFYSGVQLYWKLNQDTGRFKEGRTFLVGAFLEKKSTIVMAFRQCFFFDTPEVTKTVLPKVLQNFKKTPSCTCWSKELNQKGFPHNIQYRMRPKGPSFQVFRHCETFFRKNSSKGPFSFFGVLRQNGCCKIPKGPPFYFFGIVRLQKVFFSGAVEENTLTLCYF